MSVLLNSRSKIDFTCWDVYNNESINWKHGIFWDFILRTFNLGDKISREFFSIVILPRKYLYPEFNSLHSTW